MLGVAAILLWAGVSLFLFIIAANNGVLSHMHWCGTVRIDRGLGVRSWGRLWAGCTRADPGRTGGRQPPWLPESRISLHGTLHPHPAAVPRRWPKGHALIGHGFKSAVELTSLLSIMLVAYTCHWTLQHSVRDGAGLVWRCLSILIVASPGQRCLAWSALSGLLIPLTCLGPWLLKKRTCPPPSRCRTRAP